MIDPDKNVNSNIEFWLLEMANLENNFNPRHQVIRVEFEGGFYDLKCVPTVFVPSREDYLVVAMLPEDFFMYNSSISNYRQELPPGLNSKDGTLADLPKAICWVVNRRQTVSTTNPQNAAAGFAISGTNMFDLNNVTVALTPNLPSRDYTTLDDASSGDPNNESVGLFINRQGTVLIKSTGGSITLGKEGVHIGGKLATETSNKDTGVMMENPLSKILGSTIPTAGASWPTIPNIGTIASIANAVVKFIEIGDKGRQVAGIF